MGCSTNGGNSRIDMTSNDNSRPAPPVLIKKKSVKRTIAEKMAIAEELRDLQEALAPLREANRSKRAAGKVDIRIKTR